MAAPSPRHRPARPHTPVRRRTLGGDRGRVPQRGNSFRVIPPPPSVPRRRISGPGLCLKQDVRTNWISARNRLGTAFLIKTTCGVRRPQQWASAKIGPHLSPPAHDTLHPPPRLPLLDRGAFVVLSLAPGHRNFNLRHPMLEVQAQGDERVSLFLNLPEDTANLAPVEEELPFAQRIVVEDVAPLVRRNVHVVQPDLVALHAGERISHGGPTRS